RDVSGLVEDWITTKVAKFSSPKETKSSRRRFDVRRCDDEQGAGIEQASSTSKEVARVLHVLDDLNAGQEVESCRTEMPREVVVQICKNQGRRSGVVLVRSFETGDLVAGLLEPIGPGTRTGAEVKDTGRGRSKSNEHLKHDCVEPRNGPFLQRHLS